MKSAGCTDINNEGEKILTKIRQHPKDFDLVNLSFKRFPSSFLILIIAAIAGVTTMLPAVGMPLKRLIEPLRIAVMSHPASGNVVVVEMDARSVDAIRRWPWPRIR